MDTRYLDSITCRLYRHRLRGTFTFISSCNMLDVHMRFPAVEPEEEDEEEKEEAHDPGVK